MTAKDALGQHFSNAMFLPSPQFYEFSRLKEVSSVAQLQKLLNLRRQLGIERFCPQYFATDDGFMVTFPGSSFKYDSPVRILLSSIRCITNETHAFML